MRVVLDSNILISALIVAGSIPARILDQWRRGAFLLLTCDAHLDELRRATRYPQVRSRVRSPVSGRLINEIGELAIRVEKLPQLERSIDPFDDYLLALAEAGGADYLVTGDKAHMLNLGKHRTTRIVAARDFAALLKI